MALSAKRIPSRLRIAGSERDAGPLRSRHTWLRQAMRQVSPSSVSRVRLNPLGHKTASPETWIWHSSGWQGYDMATLQPGGPENRVASLGTDRKVFTPLMRMSSRSHSQNSKFATGSLRVSCLIEADTSEMIARSHSVGQTLPAKVRDWDAVEATGRCHLGVGSPTRRTSSSKRGSEWRLSKRSSTVKYVIK